MPEESKKNQQKGKNEPKDQRRRRQGRQPPGHVEKKPEKQPEREIGKQTKEPEKLANESPGPEFYKNLKRETDEILKITEEANTKYKKKEIQSNWAKYEMPVESYDEIDEQENMGADYEKLLQGPACAGGHFQFKHEKSWDTDTGPGLYDKYFDINMDLLSLAVSTIPFYERNSIELSMFNENDIVTMNHRATKFKHKYYNDKRYITPELVAQENILKNLTEHNNNENSAIKDKENKDTSELDDNSPSEGTLNIKRNMNPILDTEMVKRVDDSEKLIQAFSQIKETVKELKDESKFQQNVNTTTVSNNSLEDDIINLFENDNISSNVLAIEIPDTVFKKVELPVETKVVEVKPPVNNQFTIKKEAPKKPVIESPEDLEKWLDDFLDG